MRSDSALMVSGKISGSSIISLFDLSGSCVRMLAHKEGDYFVHTAHTVGLQLTAKTMHAERKFYPARYLGDHVIIKVVGQSAADERRALHICQLIRVIADIRLELLVKTSHSYRSADDTNVVSVGGGGIILYIVYIDVREAIKLLPEHFGTATRDAVLGCIYDQYLHFSSFIYFIYVELYR